MGVAPPALELSPCEVEEALVEGSCEVEGTPCVGAETVAAMAMVVAATSHLAGSQELAWAANAPGALGRSNQPIPWVADLQQPARRH